MRLMHKIALKLRLIILKQKKINAGTTDETFFLEREQNKNCNNCFKSSKILFIGQNKKNVLGEILKNTIKFLDMFCNANGFK